MSELTYAKAIEIADAYCDNEMPLTWKLEVIYNFELELMSGVMLLSQAEIELIPAPTAETAGTLTLTVKRPHAEIYWLRLVCALHEVNREYAELANMTEHFNTVYAAFVQWWTKTYHPKTGEAGFKGYYLSAYALAQKHGFAGTESEWLESLKGDKGDTGDAFTYSDFTAAQLEALKVKGDPGDKGDKGDKGDPGEKGDKGDPGADGKTPVKGVDYWTPTESAEMDAAKAAAISAADSANRAARNASAGASAANDAAFDAAAAADAANSAVANLEAKVAAGDFKGAPGDKGAPGADGYTPVRGTDYWTESDKAEIKSYVDESVVAARPAFSLLSEITLAEDASIVDITADSAGAALSLSSALLVVTVEPAAKKCYLSCTMYHGSTNSYFSTNGISTGKCGSTFLVHDIGGIRQVYIRNIGTNSIGPATNTQIGMFADGNPLTHFTLRSYDTSVSPAEWGNVALPAGTKIQLYGVKA